MSKFTRLIILRLMVIILSCFTGFYIIFFTNHWLVSIWMFLLSVVAFLELTTFIDKTKKELITFLTSIRQKDFSVSYKAIPLSKEDEELHKAYTLISHDFKNLRKAKESNYHFLQAVVEHSAVALMGYKVKDGQVKLLNQAAKDLFDKSFIPTLSTLEHVDHQLVKTILQLKSGEKKLIKILVHNQYLNLSIIAKELILEDEAFKLVSFQNIKSELDEKELESWQKLIRVLTHEIKNSAIPISTLTEVINDMIIDRDGNVKDLSKLDQDELNDIRLGLQTVEKRSKGLINFVNAYGQLAKIPQPKISTIKISQLLKDIESLLRKDIEKSNISFVVENETPLIIKADSELIEQVLINLVKNAKEAFSNQSNALIRIGAYKENDTIIAIEDNGMGIDPETLESIFIPFYTTKKEGSGIGLSLCRQIMRAHNGTITVSTTPGIGTTFYLRF